MDGWAGFSVFSFFRSIVQGVNAADHSPSLPFLHHCALGGFGFGCPAQTNQQHTLERFTVAGDILNCMERNAKEGRRRKREREREEKNGRRTAERKETAVGSFFVRDSDAFIDAPACIKTRCEWGRALKRRSTHLTGSALLLGVRATKSRSNCRSLRYRVHSVNEFAPSDCSAESQCLFISDNDQSTLALVSDGITQTSTLSLSSDKAFCVQVFPFYSRVLVSASFNKSSVEPIFGFTVIAFPILCMSTRSDDLKVTYLPKWSLFGTHM